MGGERIDVLREADPSLRFPHRTDVRPGLLAGSAQDDNSKARRASAHSMGMAGDGFVAFPAGLDPN